MVYTFKNIFVQKVIFISNCPLIYLIVDTGKNQLISDKLTINDYQSQLYHKTN